MRAKNQPSRRRRSRASLKRDYVRDNDGQFARVPGSGRGGKRSAAELAKELDDMLAKFDALAADLNDDDDDDYDIDEVREKLTSLRDRKREKENRREVDFDTGNYGEVNMAILGNGEISIVFSASAADVDMSPEMAKELVNGLDDLRKKLPPGVNAGSPRSEVIGRFESSDGTIAAEMWDDGLVEIGDPDEVGNEDTEEELFTLDLDEVPNFTDLLEELADKAGNGTKGSRRRSGTKRNYVRDGDGQFAETAGGGGSNALDKLNLAGKVPPGVTVRASRKVKTDNQDLLIAEVDTPEGPRTRIGVVNPEDSKKWGGGYHDPAKQQRIDEIREELADLDEAESEDDYDPELYEELSEELAELEDSESGNRTAEITPDQMSQLSAQLSEALEKAKANKVTQDKVSKEFDELDEREAELVAEYGDPQLEAERTRLQRQISNLRTRSAQTGGDFDRERAARDKTEFEAQLAEAQARLNHLDDTRTDGMPPEVQEEMLDIDLRRSALNNLPDIDDIIMRGGVDAADGSMLAFETWGSDVDSIGWSYTRVAIVPPGKTFDEVTDAEEYSGFDGPKGVEKLLKGLGADVGAKGRNGFMVKTGSGTMHQTKTQPRSRFTIKAADKGEFTAVVATLGQIDSDNDVTHKGAFDSSEFPLSAYGHTSWGGALPVGVARIKEVGNEAILEGRFFLDTAHGRDTFTTVKHLGELGQWSYGYDAVEYEHGYHEGKSVRFLKKLKVHEASPVLVGAGVNTRTLSTKNRNSSFSGEAATVVTAVKALTDRAADVMAMRRQRGKGLGADSVRLLTQVTGELKRLQDILDAPASDADALNEIWLRQLERVHR